MDYKAETKKILTKTIMKISWKVNQVQILNSQILSPINQQVKCHILQGILEKVLLAVSKEIWYGDISEKSAFGDQ